MVPKPKAKVLVIHKRRWETDPIEPPVIPVPVKKTYQWQFPMGDKIATLYITGESNLVVEDMDALLDIAAMFRASVVRGNRITETDYEI